MLFLLYFVKVPKRGVKFSSKHFMLYINQKFLENFKHTLHISMHIYVLLLQNKIQLFYKIQRVICYNSDHFDQFLLQGDHKYYYFFFSICCWFLNCPLIVPRNQTFIEKYEVKYILYIPEAPEEFVKYFSIYSTKGLKLF